jgi:hypothetical protein
MVAKTGKFKSESFRQVTGLNSGSSAILQQTQVFHIVLEEALLMVKKFLLHNIQLLLTQPSIREF